MSDAVLGRPALSGGPSVIRRVVAALPRPQPPALGVLVLLLVLVGGPMVTVVTMSLHRGIPGRTGPWTLDNFVVMGQDPFFLETLGNTAIFSALTLAIALVFVVPITFLLARCDIPYRSAFAVVMSLIVVVPTFLRAIGWILLLSPEIGALNRLAMAVFGLPSAPFNIYSMPGMAFVQGLSFVPAGYFMLSAAYRAMDPALEEAAYTSGIGKLGTFLRINVPITVPALLGMVVYLLMTSISVFEAPAIIGIPARIYVLSSIIALRVQPTVGLPDYGAAGAYGMVMLGVGLLLSYAYFRTLRDARRYVVLSGKGYRPRTIRLGRWKPAALAFVMVFFLLEAALPIGMLLWSSVTPYVMAPSLEALEHVTFGNYGSMLSQLNSRTVVNTVVLVLLAPLLALVLSVLASWVVVRSGSRLRGAVDLLAFMPHTVPSILFAVALAYLALLWRASIPLYGSVVLIVLAHGITFLAFGSRALNSAMIQIQRDLEEAGRLAGLSPFATLRAIVVPLVAPAILNSWFWVALLSYREVTMALILYAQKNDVLSTLIWIWWRDGKAGEVSALGTVLVLVLVAVLGVSSLVYRRVRGGGRPLASVAASGEVPL